MTDQELRDLVASNAKAIEALGKKVDALTDDIRTIANLVAQDHNRIIELEKLPSRQKSGRNNSPAVPQAAKPR